MIPNCSVLTLAQVTKEQELKLEHNRKKFDIREEYFVSLSIPVIHPL